jgi:hypothetical protein
MSGSRPPVYGILIYICGNCLYTSGRGRPHYAKYTDIEDNAVIAVKKSEIPVLIIIHVKVQRKSQILLLGLSVGGCVAEIEG